MGFADKTRLKVVPVTSMARPTGGGTTSIELPKAGILAGIFVSLQVVIGGTVNTPNALGNASAIKKLKLQLNSGHVIFDVSGIGYHYGLSQFVQDNYDISSYTDAKLAVTTGTKVLDMFIPVSLNTRDELGYLMLQNMQTFASLIIDWETELVVGGSTATITSGTAKVALLVLEVPSTKEDQPKLDKLHMCLEEQFAIPSTADYDHRIAIGATLVGEYYILPAGFTRAQLRLQNSNIIYDLVPEVNRMFHMLMTSRDINLAATAITGTDKRLLLDFAGSDGLGQFGSFRDFVDTRELTDFICRITPVAAMTVYAVRRQIVDLNAS